MPTTEKRKGGEEVGTVGAKDALRKLAVNQSQKMGQQQEVAVLSNQPFLPVLRVCPPPLITN